MSARAPIRVLHIVSSIRGYGAEHQVLRLMPLLQSPQITAGVLAVYGSRLTNEERARLAFPIIDVGRATRSNYLFLPRMISCIRKFRPDVVHTHTHVGKYWGRFAAMLAGVRVIVHTEHNPCDPRRSALEAIADGALHAQTSRVITFLTEQRPVLCEREGLPLEKVAIIPNGIPMDEVSNCSLRMVARQRLDVSAEQFAVMVIGRLEFQKNHELALRALSCLEPHDRERIRMYFAGSGVLEQELRALSHALGHDDVVTFLGYRGDVPILLHGADLLLLTSHFEGMPLVVIEAMLAGVPVLTTPWTGADAMLGNGRYGFLASGWEPEVIAAELRRLLLNDTLRSAVADRAGDHVRAAYDIRATALAHRELYLHLCRKSKAS